MKPSSIHLLQLSGALFTAFIIIGLPLPVLPLYLHNTLGFGTAMVGLAVGAHFLSTVLFRNLAGRLADTYGGKRTTMAGALTCSLSGVPYLVVVLLPELSSSAQFAIILCGRVCLGIGHSMLGTGNLSWGFGLLGQQHVGRVIAWAGIANYGAVALGAPLGLVLWDRWGIAAIGVATCLLPLIAFGIDSRAPDAAKLTGERPSLGGILRKIWHPGICLALHGMGYAIISAFISLYFATNNWAHAGIALTCFGLSFALVRIVCGELPDRMDGKKLTLICLFGEAVGLATVGFAPSALVAFIGVSITGLSCSLIFPAIGVQVVRSVPAHTRGAAVGAFTAFQDISYGLSGPLTGLLVPSMGFPFVFYTASACAVIAFAMVTRFPGEKDTIAQG